MPASLKGNKEEPSDQVTQLSSPVVDCIFTSARVFVFVPRGSFDAVRQVLQRPERRGCQLLHRVRTPVRGETRVSPFAIRTHGMRTVREEKENGAKLGIFRKSSGK